MRDLYVLSGSGLLQLRRDGGISEPRRRGYVSKDPSHPKTAGHSSAPMQVNPSILMGVLKFPAL